MDKIRQVFMAFLQYSLKETKREIEYVRQFFELYWELSRIFKYFFKYFLWANFPLLPYFGGNWSEHWLRSPVVPQRAVICAQVSFVDVRATTPIWNGISYTFAYLTGNCTSKTASNQFRMTCPMWNGWDKTLQLLLLNSF